MPLARLYRLVRRVQRQRCTAKFSPCHFGMSRRHPLRYVFIALCVGDDAHIVLFIYYIRVDVGINPYETTLWFCKTIYIVPPEVKFNRKMCLYHFNKAL